MPQKVSRRAFATFAGLAALGLNPSGSEGASRAPASRRGLAPGTFPDDFIWGTATSAYQVEGAVGDDGRGPSIWDTFSHQAGHIADGSNADRATDHYHRYKDDIGLIRALGLRHYRFSIAWSRVFPNGTGSPNPRGLDFYDRLLDTLLENGITPYVTLYHWDLPQALQDRFGGWQSAATSKAFADYCGYVAARITDRAKTLFTLNEVGRFLDFGYGLGIDAPGLRLAAKEVNQARHHAALAHGLAVQSIRAHAHAGTRIGPAENIATCLPAVDTPDNVRAAEIATREMNAGYLNLIIEGRYSDAFLRYAGKNAPSFTAEELKIIGTRNDFIGLNIYAPQFYVVASEKAPGFSVLPVPGSFPHMKSEWLRVAPETAYWVPRLAAKVWNLDTIYITENGTSSTDEPSADGRIYDLDRIMFLRNYLLQLQRAVAEGAPVRGYFLWSLMDNFEWIYGFGQRFGLYHVDFDTLKRRPKLSADFYRTIVAHNAVGR